MMDISDKISQPSNRSMATDPAIARRKPARYSKSRKSAYRAPYKRQYARSARYQPKTAQISKQLAIKVPDCAMHYIDALFDPFAIHAGVCVPAGNFPIPSQKVKVFLRGTLALSTAGYGFICLAPTASSDQVAVQYSSNVSVGTNATLFTNFTNKGNGTFGTLPYSSTDIVTNNTVQARIVAAGVRARYASTENGRSGVYISYEDQDCLDTNTNHSFSTLLQLANTSTTRPSGDGDWDSSVCFSGPVEPAQVEFTRVNYPVSQGNSGYPMCLAFQGVAGDIIEWEAVQHVEYIGTKVPGKTASHADAVAYGKVLEATKSISTIQPIKPSLAEQGKKSFFDRMMETIPTIIDVGSKIIPGLISSVATGNPLPLIGSAAASVGGLLTAGPSPQPRYTSRQLSIMN